MSKVGVKKMVEVGHCSACGPREDGRKVKITIRDGKQYCGGCAPPSTWIPPVIDRRSDLRNTRWNMGERGEGEDESKEPETRGI